MKTTRTAPIAVLVAASLAVAACSGDQQPAEDCTIHPAAMPEEMSSEFARLLDQWDPVEFGRHLTADARFLPPNMPAIEGRDAIVEHYKGAVANELDYEVAALNQVTIGNVGLAEGTYRVKNLTNDTYVEEGKYLSVWVHLDGVWKVARLMVNTDYEVARTSITVGDPAPAP